MGGGGGGGGGGVGGGRAYKRNKKKTSKGTVDRNKFFKLKSQNKATFSTVQYCNPAEGALNSGEKGGRGYNRLYICVSGEGGGGGLITGILRYVEFSFDETRTAIL